MKKIWNKFKFSLFCKYIYEFELELGIQKNQTKKKQPMYKFEKGRKWREI